MKLLLVDLDDTLIDTSTFRDEFLAALIPFNPEVIAIYNQVKAQFYEQSWLEKFATLLNPARKHQVLEIIDRCLNRLKVNQKIAKYVEDFPGYRVIFTYGNHELQMKKIKATSLDQIVDRVLITTMQKADLLVSISLDNAIKIDSINFSDVEVIDDRQWVLQDIQEKVPWIKTLHTSKI